MVDGMQPIAPIRGRVIAESWWAKAWNRNLEDYSDYSNRLSRGRSYMRNGSITDLRISEGKVEAKVMGSRSRPYDVSISVKVLDEVRIRRIADACGSRVSNISSLMNGDFPEDVGEMFLSQDGLFPKPSEIKFKCSCPDWAYMCKHVAAVLYGIGRRFDTDPTMFFVLRGVDLEPLVNGSIESRLESMLSNVRNRSSRVIPEDRLMELFGMDLDVTTVENDDHVEEPFDDVTVPEERDVFNDALAITLSSLIIHPRDPEAFVERVRSDLRLRYGSILGSFDVGSASEIVHTLSLGIDEGLRRNPGGAPLETRRAGEYLVAWMLQCEGDGLPANALGDVCTRLS